MAASWKASPATEIHALVGGVQEIRALLGSPDSKDHSILAFVFGALHMSNCQYYG